MFIEKDKILGSIDKKLVSFNVAQGGNEYTYVDGSTGQKYKVHVFDSSAYLKVNVWADVSVLIVGAGGWGSLYYGQPSYQGEGGQGGGGGEVKQMNMRLKNKVYEVKIARDISTYYNPSDYGETTIFNNVSASSGFSSQSYNILNPSPPPTYLLKYNGGFSGSRQEPGFALNYNEGPGGGGDSSSGHHSGMSSGNIQLGWDGHGGLGTKSDITGELLGYGGGGGGSASVDWYYWNPFNDPSLIGFCNGYGRGHDGGGDGKMNYYSDASNHIDIPLRFKYATPGVRGGGGGGGTGSLDVDLGPPWSAGKGSKGLVIIRYPV